MEKRQAPHPQPQPQRAAPPPPVVTARAAKSGRGRGAFSLIELVAVVMIIAVLAAIAASRLSRMVGEADRNATAATVIELQKAIDRYQGEHGDYPTAADLGPQLTRYTDSAGNVSATRSVAHPYGPYIKAAPPLHPGPAGTALLWKPTAAEAKWVYDPSVGQVRPN
jgi:prepilin-type N-terminal cleavage/methylation domain-containing protein